MGLLLLVPVGFATKFYAGPAAFWVNHRLGGVLYVAFWIGVVKLVRPAWPTSRVAWGVLAATCALEFSQLSDAWVLEAARRNFLGRTLVGTTFGWWDFPYYALGAWIGRRAVDRIAAPSPPSRPVQS